MSIFIKSKEKSKKILLKKFYFWICMVSEIFVISFYIKNFFLPKILDFITWSNTKNCSLQKNKIYPDVIFIFIYIQNNHYFFCIQELILYWKVITWDKQLNLYTQILNWFCVFLNIELSNLGFLLVFNKLIFIKNL